ncbi:MAG: hypothetical protein L6R42_007926 [Xanthoria sp. 1 TBL-2021]|nr:MAG: hypothetical protein L6R42_007926 [Xanthoria sp. 1 TBL-2021]
MLSPRSLYSDPPPSKDLAANRPTLLVSWWCTGFALAIILFRICGRYIRTERLFREDMVMACSMVPLLGRMALVHVVLIYGTNNVSPDALSAKDLHRREVGSKLVLASRIMYAAFLWTAKLTVSEFLKRLTNQFWRQQYEYVLQFIRWFLAITFVAVVIATLAECQPFGHYWQVVPNPGAKCRQGYAQLITMGSSDVITDLLLVTFPIPIVLKSHMAAKRKASLILLFSLSLVLIAITIYRVVEVVHRHSDQQFRSLLASLEILAAAAVSNALALGSFVRDRGVKKQRYRYGSVGGHSSLDRAATGTRPRALTAQTWGSDADLAGELGMRMAPDLEQQQIPPTRPRPAPLALPQASYPNLSAPKTVRAEYEFVNSDRGDMEDDPDSSREVEKPLSPRGLGVATPRRASFFDVGGVLDHQEASPIRLSRPEQTTSEITPAPLPSDGRRDNSPPANNRGLPSWPDRCISVSPASPRLHIDPISKASHSSRPGGDPVRRKCLQESEPGPSFKDIGGLLG